MWVCKVCTLENEKSKEKCKACGEIDVRYCKICNQELGAGLCLDKNCSACQWYTPIRSGRNSCADFRKKGALTEYRWVDGDVEEWFPAMIECENTAGNYTVCQRADAKVWKVRDVLAEDIRPVRKEPVVDDCPTGCEGKAKFAVDVGPADMVWEKGAAVWLLYGGRDEEEAWFPARMWSRSVGGSFTVHSDDETRSSWKVKNVQSRNIY